MKRPLKTLRDALAFQLAGLYYAETKVKDELKSCSEHLFLPILKREIKKYLESSDSKLLKLERIFNYLMQEPKGRKNKVFNELMDETKKMILSTNSPHLKDILMISCVQNICSYKVSSYKTAYLFAVELELDIVADLIQHILAREVKTGTMLAELAIEEFNRIQRADKLQEKIIM